MIPPVPERVLVVGSGSIAQRHVRNLVGLGVPEVVVWSARDISGIADLVGPGISVVSELPGDCPSVAIVANDTNRHLETSRRLAERNVHMLVEKPVAAEVSGDLLDLCEEVRQRGLVCRVAYNMRFLGALSKAKEALDAGVLGRLLFARIEVGQWLPDWRPNRPFQASYSASIARGGGVALDLSHEVDYMLMLFGAPSAWCVSDSHSGALEIESADVFDAIYSFSGGFSCTLHLDYLEKTLRRRLRIVGTEGVIECDLAARTLSLDALGVVQSFDEPHLFDRSATFVEELESFFAEVSGADLQGVRLPNLEEGCDVLRLLSNSRPSDTGSRRNLEGASS